MRDIIKTIVILSVIAVISGVLLGAVNSITQVDADEQLKAKLSLVYDYPAELVRIELISGNPTLNPSIDEEITRFGVVLDAFKSSDDTYVLRALGKGGYAGDVELLYAIKDNKILKMAVFKSAETPGLGTKGFDQNYLNKYYDKDISDTDKFTITKSSPSNDSEIKAISGATYTSNAIANATNIAAYWYNLNGPYANSDN